MADQEQETRTLRAPFFNYTDEDGRGRTLTRGQEVPDDLPEDVVKKGEEAGAFSDSPEQSPDQAARAAREAYLPLDLSDYDGNGPPDQPLEQAAPEEDYDDSPGEPEIDTTIDDLLEKAEEDDEQQSPTPSGAAETQAAAQAPAHRRRGPKAESEQ